MFAILPCIYLLSRFDFLVFFVTVSKVEEELDEGVQSETEGSENISFLGQDQIKEDKNAADSLQFEELTEEVKLALQQIFFPILVANPLNLSSKGKVQNKKIKIK